MSLVVSPTVALQGDDMPTIRPDFSFSITAGVLDLCCLLTAGYVKALPKMERC
jgi:hypothetical protein